MLSNKQSTWRKHRASESFKFQTEDLSRILMRLNMSTGNRARVEQDYRRKTAL